MPELPEVERAVVELRRHIVGRKITAIAVHHPALRRRITPRELRSVTGARITGVRRRGKHQLLDLDDGRILHAHFRMSGDWLAGSDAQSARHARATISLDDGSAVVLDDPRALSSIVLVPAGTDPVADLGPDADDVAVDPRWLHERLSRRRIAIKVALLDQSVISGVGNIYAAEALWDARIDPRRAANDLDRREVARLLKSIRKVLERASGERYDSDGRFKVYDREGEKCRRCGSTVTRIPQAGRSTYFCARCQL